MKLQWCMRLALTKKVILPESCIKSKLTGWQGAKTSLEELLARISYAANAKLKGRKPHLLSISHFLREVALALVAKHLQESFLPSLASCALFQTLQLVLLF